MEKEDLQPALWHSTLRTHQFRKTAAGILIDDLFTVTAAELQELKAGLDEDTERRIRIAGTTTGFNPDYILSLAAMFEQIRNHTPEAQAYKTQQREKIRLARELLNELQEAGDIFCSYHCVGHRYISDPNTLKDALQPPEYIINLYRKACSLEERKDSLGYVWVEYEAAEKEETDDRTSCRIFIRHHTPVTERDLSAYEYLPRKA